MNEFEMADYIDGAREMVFMAMDEHGMEDMMLTKR